MRSNYKPIGKYVRQVSLRNNDARDLELKGIRINKEFMPSVANVTGTDLSKYRVVQKHQFAFNPMHVGRDEVLPISMLEADEDIIVSPAYIVFEIIDKNELDPEYLMMWCRRPEFDRNAWFTTDSSVRGGFSWDAFCEMELPVPSIEKQREIVKEYNTIVNRIKLNEQLNQKLEETAQAIYKQWFVDFEFPISEEYANSIGNPELIGKPYKSNGGEMVFNELLQQDIPKEWSSCKVEDIAEITRGASPRPIDEYMSLQGMPWVKISDASASLNKYLMETKEFIKQEGIAKSRKVKMGTLILSNSASPGLPMIMNIEACVHDGWLIFKNYKKITKEFIYNFLIHNRQDILTSGNGSVFNNLKTDILKSYKIIIPNKLVLNEASGFFNVIDKSLLSIAKDTKNSMGLKNILLSSMASKQLEAV